MANQNSMIPAIPENSEAYVDSQPTLHDLYAMSWLLAGKDSRNANPNIKGNPLHGYGNAPAEYSDIAGQFDDRGYLDALNQAANTQASRDDITQMLNLLKNAQEYNIDTNKQLILGDRAPDLQARANGFRGLYGDMVVDLLQNTPKGQQIINALAGNAVK
jgi:hypothetical protein